MKGLPEYIKIIVLIYLTLFIVVISIGNTLLWCYIKDRKTKASSFIRAIIISTIPIVVISLPIYYYQMVGNYQNTSIRTCYILLTIQLAVLFLSKIIIIHLIAMMSLTRYLDFKGSEYKAFTKNIMLIIAVTIIYCFMLIIPIIYDIMRPSKSSRCVIDRDIDSKDDTKIATIIIVSISIIITSTIIHYTTIMLRRSIQAHQEKFSFLTKSRQSINSRRITVTVILWISFIIYWLPYGVVRSLSGVLTDNYFLTLDILMSSLAYASFFSLPLVYYFMDPGYQSLLQRITKRSRHIIHPSKQANVPN